VNGAGNGAERAEKSGERSEAVSGSRKKPAERRVTLYRRRTPNCRRFHNLKKSKRVLSPTRVLGIERGTRVPVPITTL